MKQYFRYRRRPVVTSGNLLVVALTWIFFFTLSCGSPEKKAGPAEATVAAPASDGMKSDFQRRFGCSVLYISGLASDSTFTVVYIAPAEEKETTRFYTADSMSVCAGLYKLNAGNIIPVRMQQFRQLESTYLEIDSTSPRYLQIDRQPYFYFAANEMFKGKAVLEQHVVFHLISLNELKDYTLVYTGMNDFKCDNCIAGAFEEASWQRHNPALYDTLTALSSKSYMIYHRTAADEDPYSYLNYETKWTTDNKADNTFGAGYWEVLKPIRTTYYTTDLFEKNMATPTDTIENENYRIISFFRSNLIAYDKQKKLFFPVIIEACNYFCTKQVQFIAPDVLTLTHEDSEYTDTLSLTQDFIFDPVRGR